MDKAQLVSIDPFLYCFTIFVSVSVTPLCAMAIEIPNDDMWLVLRTYRLQRTEVYWWRLVDRCYYNTAQFSCKNFHVGRFWFGGSFYNSSLLDKDGTAMFWMWAFDGEDHPWDLWAVVVASSVSLLQAEDIAVKITAQPC
jgi:hypothetical protein